MVDSDIITRKSEIKNGGVGIMSKEKVNGKVKADMVEDKLIEKIDQLNNQWQGKLAKVQAKETLSLSQVLEGDPQPLSITQGLAMIKDSMASYVASRTSRERKDALAIAFAAVVRVKDVAIDKSAFLLLYGRLKTDQGQDTIGLDDSLPNPYKGIRIKYVAPALRKLSRALNLGGDYISAKLELQNIISHMPF